VVHCDEYAKEVDALYYAASTAPKPDILAVDVMMKGLQNDTAHEKLRVLRLERGEHEERERIRLERHWMEQDISVVNAHYVRIQAEIIVHETLQQREESDERVAEAIKRRHDLIQAQLMKQAAKLVQDALASTRVDNYDGPALEDTPAVLNLAKMRVTLMVWLIMPQLRSIVTWRTQVTAHIVKQKEVVKKDFQRSERLAACFYRPDNGTAKEVGLKRKMGLLNLDNPGHFLAHAETQRLHLHRMFLQDQGEALSDFDQEVKDRFDRVEANLDESESRQYSAITRRRDCSDEALRNAQAGGDPVAKARSLLMRLHGMSDCLIIWQLNKRREKRRGLMKLTLYFKTMQYEVSMMRGLVQMCTLNRQRQKLEWRAIIPGWRAKLLVKKQKIAAEKAKAQAYAANQRKLIADRREAREAAEREKMMQGMAADRLAGLKS